MKINKFFLLGLTITIISASCKKEDTPAPPAPVVITGAYILNEGNYGANNSTLSYYNFSNSTVTNNFYQSVNGSGLGDSGNDILIYGSKMYIVMNVSSYVQVADALTAVAIKKLPFEITPGGVKRQPRYAVGYKNKVLVSSFDGTLAVIDTASLTIEKFITVGSNPDGLAISGDNLYVANSGGLNPLFDSTLSVINLNSFTETQRIRVGINPGSVAADNAGNIYVACTGNYGSVGAKLVKVNAATNTVTNSVDTAVGDIRFYNGFLYVTGGYLGSSKVRTLNTTDFAATRANFVTDGTNIVLPYGINIDETNGDVYVMDGKDYSSSGEVFCFDKTGKKKFSFSVAPGILPNTVVFIRK